MSDSTYLLPLKSRSLVANGTIELRFDKPEGMTFKAGQFVDFTLVDPPQTDAKGDTRALSFNNAPTDSELIFTTRVRDSAFKHVISTMALGTQVKIEGPFGDFTLHNKATRPAVLIAGGIGITPFRSMIRRAAQERLDHKVFLFYANKRPEDAAFIDELEALEKENSNFKFVPTMDQMAESKRPWSGETGYINQAMLDKYLRDAKAHDPIYYMAGPPGLVAALRKTLNDAGVDDDDIRTEEFSGY